MSDQPPHSNPCMMADTDPGYHGFYSRQELLTLLYDLLHGERAGARICALSLRDAATPPQQELLKAIQRDEAASCRRLIDSLQALGAEPDQANGDFLDKCMAIDNLISRLQLLNKGQRWVVRKINEALPKIQQQYVQRQLAKILEDHQRNVALLDNFLAGDSSATDKNN